MHVFDFTPEDLARLRAADLWRLLRALTIKDMERGTEAQWLAVLDAVLRHDPARRARYGRRFTALFLSSGELHELHAAFRADVVALRKQLPSGSQPNEILAPFAERVVWLASERYAGLWNGLRLPTVRGRRPQFTRRRHTGHPPSPAGGRPKKFTADDETWFLDEIDRWRAELAERGLRVSDKEALHWSMAQSYYRRAREQ